MTFAHGFARHAGLPAQVLQPRVSITRTGSGWGARSAGTKPVSQAAPVWSWPCGTACTSLGLTATWMTKVADGPGHGFADMFRNFW